MKSLKFQVFEVLVHAWIPTCKREKKVEKNVKDEDWASRSAFGESPKEYFPLFVCLREALKEEDQKAMKGAIDMSLISSVKERYTT